MKPLLIVVSILLSLILRSQQIIPLNEKPYLDSLKNVANGKTGNESRANAYYLLSNYYRNTDSIVSKKYLMAGKILSKNNSFLTAKYSYYEGQYYLDKNKEKAASSYQQSIKALSKFNTEESDFLQSLAWYNYGVSQKTNRDILS